MTNVQRVSLHTLPNPFKLTCVSFFCRTQKSKPVLPRHQILTESLPLKKQARSSRPHLKICTPLLPAASHCEIKISQTAERPLNLAGPGRRARKTGKPTAPAAFMPATSRTNGPANSSTSRSQDKKRTICMPKLATPPNPIPKINLPSPSSLALKKVHWRVYRGRCGERLKCEEAAR